MYQLVVSLLLVLIFIPVPFLGGSVCRDDPLSVYGDHGGRYTVVDECITVTGEIGMLADETLEQGGERHIYLIGTQYNRNTWAPGWLDIEFVDVEIPSITELLMQRSVTVTGSLVWDAERQWYAIKPAFWLHDIYRAYPERRADGSVWRVWQWVDGHYSQERVY